MSVVSNANIPGYNLIQVPGLSDQQKELLSSLLSKTQPGVVGGLDLASRLAAGDISTFKEREAPALRQFQEQILPSIANRFSSQGALKSSGFQNAAAAQGANLAENLQSQRQNIQRQALQDLLGLSENLLGQRPDIYGLQKVEKGPNIGEIIAGVGSNLLPLLSLLF